MSEFFRDATINTMVAPWWEITLAKLFGNHAISRDDYFVVELVIWRGKTYVLGCFKEPDIQEENQ